MLEVELKNCNIAAFFNDPGGAKLLLSALCFFKASYNVAKCYSTRDYPFTSDFNITCEVQSLGNVNLDECLENIDLVLTSTSIPVSTELAALKRAKDLGIRTVVLVDRSSNYIDRFVFESEIVCPDVIYNCDSVSKTDLEPFEDAAIYSMANYYHKYLSNFQPTISKKNILSTLGVTGFSYLVYAPEPISRFNLQNKYGFDEVDGLVNVLRAIDKAEIHIPVVFLAHPNQKTERLLDVLSLEERCIIVSPEGLPQNDLIYHSTLMISYYSSIVLESALLANNVVRPLWFSKKDDNLLTQVEGFSNVVTCLSEQDFIRTITSLNYNGSKC